MGLSPLLALGIPEFDRGETSPCHAKVRGVEDIASLAIHIDRTIAETEYLQRREFTASRWLDNAVNKIVASTHLRCMATSSARHS